MEKTHQLCWKDVWKRHTIYVAKEIVGVVGERIATHMNEGSSVIFCHQRSHPRLELLPERIVQEISLNQTFQRKLCGSKFALLVHILPP